MKSAKLSCHHAPGYGNYFFIQALDFTSAVKKKPGCCFSVFFQEGLQSGNISIPRVFRRFHFNCHCLPAVLHHEVDFRPIAPAPEGKPTGRGHKARQKAQVMVDERFKVSAILARFSQILQFIIARKKGSQPWVIQESFWDFSSRVV